MPEYFYLWIWLSEARRFSLEIQERVYPLHGNPHLGQREVELLAAADVKDAQMRHSLPSTTLGIYPQFGPESHRRVAERLSTLSQSHSIN